MSKAAELAKFIADGTLGSDVTDIKHSDGTSSVGINLESDSWRITANVTASSGTHALTANWERVDGAGGGGSDGVPVGTGLSESSGIFSFGKTGVYLIQGVVNGQVGVSNNVYLGIHFQTTTDDGTYSTAAYSWTNNMHGGTNAYHQTNTSFTFDVTNTSTHKFKMLYESGVANGSILGGTGTNSTHFTCVRIGNT